MLSIGIYDGEKFANVSGWEEWLDYVGQRAAVDLRYRTIYAHNGSGWDWLSLVEWIIKTGQWDTLLTSPPILRGDDLLALKLDVGGKVVTLVDSMLLLLSSLNDAGKKFSGRGKVKLEHLPEWYWKNDRRKYNQYLREDCILLHDVMCKVADTVFSVAPISRLGITLPATAMRVFRTSFLGRTLFTPNSVDLREWLRKGYKGGRVEALRPGFYKRIRVYDVNSMYPAVMSTTPVPDSGGATYTTRKDFDGCGVFHVRFSQKNRNVPPLLMVGGDGSYEGEGYYYTPELRRFRGRLDVLGGWVFDSESVLFRSYVETLYALRMKDKDGPLGVITKRLLVSLYGKFGQKTETETLVIANEDDVQQYIDRGNDPVCVNEEYGLHRITEQCEVPHEHCGIAGIITSESRGRLWEFLDSNTVYCDTDSIHTTKTLPTSDKLGGLKLEYEGEGVYAGKKLYALRGGKETKIRAKGVKVGGERGCSLTFDDLRKVVDGAKVECRFASAPTLNNVIRGGKSCTFDGTVNKTTQRKRTIRKTANDPR